MSPFLSNLKEKFCPYKLFKSKKENCEKREGYCSRILFLIFHLLLLFVALIIMGMFLMWSLSSFGESLFGIDFRTIIEQKIKGMVAGEYTETRQDGLIEYVNTELGISFSYPKEWKIKTDNNSIILKEFNYSSSKDFNSIAMSVSIGKMNITENSLEDFLRKKKEIVEFKIAEFGGNKVYQLEHEKVGDLHKVSYYWDREQIYYLDALFYNKKHDHADEDVLKILKSVKFIK